MIVEECNVDERMDPIFRADAISFAFEFENADETPKDISGDKLIFSMMLDPESPDGKAGDLTHEITFPSNADSVLGIGSMIVPKEKTPNLAFNTDYHYDFKYIEDGVPTTIGSGLVLVKLNVTKAVS